MRGEGGEDGEAHGARMSLGGPVRSRTAKEGGSREACRRRPTKSADKDRLEVVSRQVSRCMLFSKAVKCAGAKS